MATKGSRKKENKFIPPYHEAKSVKRTISFRDGLQAMEDLDILIDGELQLLQLFWSTVLACWIEVCTPSR